MEKRETRKEKHRGVPHACMSCHVIHHWKQMGKRGRWEKRSAELQRQNGFLPLFLLGDGFHRASDACKGEDHPFYGSVQKP